MGGFHSADGDTKTPILQPRGNFLSSSSQIKMEQVLAPYEILNSWNWQKEAEGKEKGKTVSLWDVRGLYELLHLLKAHRPVLGEIIQNHTHKPLCLHPWVCFQFPAFFFLFGQDGSLLELQMRFSMISYAAFLSCLNVFNNTWLFLQYCHLKNIIKPLVFKIQSHHISTSCGSWTTKWTPILLCYTVVFKMKNELWKNELHVLR